ncbi:unnamed protein product [Lactuca saligna]|uniref:PB1-like domain-containing protein n=1 Tax=Lactuca saligna TaxID=75948 RepID=A0AA36DXZ1_LACSI|nr:unnamed protein product [Lactuca saligna]
MAGPSNAKGSTYIQVDVHYDGMFSPIPHLIYYLNQKTSITDVDFGGLNFKEFIHVLEDVTKGKCPVVYYCLGHKSMRDGLTPLKNDDDYRRFLDVAHGNEGKINVYIDHYNDSVLDWIEEEKEEKNVDSESSDEDKDSVMSDALSVDHEPDEEVIPLTKSDDPFLNYISVVPRDEFVDEDDDSDNGTKEAPIYPYHDSTQKWDTMQPILGMRFCNPQELKRLPGRPKVNRKKAASEKEGRHTISKKGAITKCSICREPGHNKITCPLSKEGPSTKAKKKKGKHVPDVEDESEFEIEEMDEVENEYESEIEELAEDGDEPDQGQVEEPAAQPVVEVEQRAQPLKRKRKYSERITKVALSRVVNTKDGCGLSVNKPVTLE